MNERKHEAVIVKVGDRREEIDVMLAPLIEAIWRAGIATMMSCQETEPGIAWVAFDTIDDLKLFRDMVVWFEDDEQSLYARANSPRFGYSVESPWEYQLNIIDCFEDQPEQTEDDCASFEFWVGLYFPQSDIPELVERLTAFASAPC